MSIAWGSLRGVLVVSRGASVLVVSLVAFALVGLGARTAGPDTRPATMSPATGTAVAVVCLVGAAAIVLNGLSVMIIK